MQVQQVQHMQQVQKEMKEELEESKLTTDRLKTKVQIFCCALFSGARIHFVQQVVHHVSDMNYSAR